MERLLELLAGELEQERNLPSQVARHLNATYGISRDAVGAFLEQELERLEDYEIDLILSPVFTPTLKDQAIFAPLLGKSGLTGAAIDALIQQLVARGTVAKLSADDGEPHRLRLREVSVARYVQRLRLDGEIADGLYDLILKVVPETDRAMVLAVARRAVWSSEPRAELLKHYLQRAAAAGELRSEDVVILLRLVEMYEPGNLVEFQSRLPAWIEGVRQEAVAASQPKPFFNERVEDMHGGGRDQRRAVDARGGARDAELEAYRRLLRIVSS